MFWSSLQVICFVLRNENAHLLSSVSIWAQQPDESEVALLERILELETLEVRGIDIMKIFNGDEKRDSLVSCMIFFSKQKLYGHRFLMML